MCAYITHIRACYVCSEQETVLITESPCPVAKQTGVFGSCGLGSSNEESQTPYQCWKCRERVRGISSAAAAATASAQHQHQKQKQMRAKAAAAAAASSAASASSSYSKR